MNRVSTLAARKGSKDFNNSNFAWNITRGADQSGNLSITQFVTITD